MGNCFVEGAGKTQVQQRVEDHFSLFNECSYQQRERIKEQTRLLESGFRNDVVEKLLMRIPFQRREFLLTLLFKRVDGRTFVQESFEIEQSVDFFSLFLLNLSGEALRELFLEDVTVG